MTANGVKTDFLFVLYYFRHCCYRERRMKVASKVVFLFRDAEGFGSSIYDALESNPSSRFERKECSFELSLEKYGINDAKASGDVLHFIDHEGSYQVSVVLLQDCETPMAACVVNEVLASITSDNLSSVPTLILPLLVPASKLHSDMTNSISDNKKVTLFSTQIGVTTDFTRGLVSGMPKPPPTLQIHYEPLSCLLQLVHILKMPAVLIIGPKGGHQAKRTPSDGLEVFYELGEFLARNTGLCFSKDKVRWSPTTKTEDSGEPWRAFYR